MKKSIFIIAATIIVSCVILGAYKYQESNQVKQLDEITMANIEALTTGSDNDLSSKKYIVTAGSTPCTYTVNGMVITGVMTVCNESLYGGSCVSGCIRNL